MSEQAQPAVARRRRERESLRSMIPARYLLKKIRFDLHVILCLQEKLRYKLFEDLHY